MEKRIFRSKNMILVCFGSFYTIFLFLLVFIITSLIVISGNPCYILFCGLCILSQNVIFFLEKSVILNLTLYFLVFLLKRQFSHYVNYVKKKSFKFLVTFDIIITTFLDFFFFFLAVKGMQEFSDT